MPGQWLHFGVEGPGCDWTGYREAFWVGQQISN